MSTYMNVSEGSTAPALYPTVLPQYRDHHHTVLCLREGV